MRRFAGGLAVAAAIGVAGVTLVGSSHREAPAITKTPKLDGTDLYMFRSYEPGRSDYVTFLANYYPLHEIGGGPNFFMLEPDAVYEIHVDNNGNAIEDLTFQFRFRNNLKGLTVPVGDRNTPVPVINIGGIGPDPDDTANLNVLETYTLSVIRGDRRTGKRQLVTNVADGSTTFKKPTDRIGDKSIRNNDPTLYGQYADRHIYDIAIPGCSTPGRVFVGQRREGFAINVVEIFDLINLNPLGPETGERNGTADKNVTSIALEVPIACLVARDPIIGAWTTSSAGKKAVLAEGSKGNKHDDNKHDDNEDDDEDDHGATPPGQFTQVSRLSHPLVNEVVIGLPDKDKFNASEPKNDAQFLQYVTHPSLPVLIQALFDAPPPPAPRNDLVTVFLTGIPGLNQPQRVSPAEIMRLNTSISPVAAAQQNRLGVIGGDTAGFPNGRRPGDDVVDIELRVLEGILCQPAPGGCAFRPTPVPGFPAFTDGTLTNSMIAYTPDGFTTTDPNFRLYRETFPYLRTPLSGSPDPIHQQPQP